MTKNYVCCARYLRNHTSYDCHLWYTSVKWWYLQAFFSFFQNFDFQVISGVIRTKNSTKWQKNCVLHSISQEPCIIWLLFLVHQFKMIIPSGVFFIFSKFWFFGLGQSKVRKWPKMTKNCLLHLIFQEPYVIWSSLMVHMCKRIVSPGVSYSFSKF